MIPATRNVHRFPTLHSICQLTVTLTALVVLQVPFFGVVYNNICLYSFGAYQCTPLRDGRYVLSAAPSIICYTSSDHIIMMVIAAFAIFVYLIVFPGVVLGYVAYGQRKDLLKTKKYLTIFGLFYTFFGACAPACACAWVRRMIGAGLLGLGYRRSTACCSVGSRLWHTQCQSFSA